MLQVSGDITRHPDRPTDRKGRLMTPGEPMTSITGSEIDAPTRQRHGELRRW
jgi:hypothetical protein